MIRIGKNRCETTEWWWAVVGSVLVTWGASWGGQVRRVYVARARVTHLQTEEPLVTMRCRVCHRISQYSGLSVAVQKDGPYLTQRRRIERLKAIIIVDIISLDTWSRISRNVMM
jgi:hypothetical protein